MFVISFSKKINKAMPMVEKELKKYKFNLGKKIILFITDTLAVFYVNDDRLHGYDNDALRYITDAPTQGIMMPMVKEELIKNNVIMDSKDIWLMTYDIVQVTRKNDRSYSELEIGKIIQEYITKNIYKNFADYSFEEDVKKAMPIVEDELRKNNLILGEEKLKRFTKKMMAVFYGKGDSFNEEWIREMTVESIQSLIMPTIKNELEKNNVSMDKRDIWLMTYDIMQTSHNNGGGCSEPEIRKITQEYITKNIYENYRGYYFSEDVKKAMPIAEEELKKNNVILREEETLKQFTEALLGVLYGKGGYYKEEAIRYMSSDEGASFFIKPIVEDELTKNKVVMEHWDMVYMVYDIMKTSKKNGGGYSESEMRKITQEYISKNLYKNFIGYAKKSNSGLLFSLISLLYDFFEKISHKVSSLFGFFAKITHKILKKRTPK